MLAVVTGIRLVEMIVPAVVGVLEIVVVIHNDYANTKLANNQVVV